MLVRNFTPPYSFVGILKQPRGLARKDQVLSRVHSALKHIADLVPLAPAILSPIVSQRRPIYAEEPVSSIDTSLSAIQL
jgi:RNA polymerase I-specific transcription initiation factor RRN3